MARSKEARQKTPNKKLQPQQKTTKEEFEPDGRVRILENPSPGGKFLSGGWVKGCCGYG